MMWKYTALKEVVDTWFPHSIGARNMWEGWSCPGQFLSWQIYTSRRIFQFNQNNWKMTQGLTLKYTENYLRDLANDDKYKGWLIRTSPASTVVWWTSPEEVESLRLNCACCKRHAVSTIAVFQWRWIVLMME